MSVTIPSTNFGISPYSVYFIIKNVGLQTVGTQVTTASQNPGTTSTFMGSVTVMGGPGTYTENVFVVDSQGSSISPSISSSITIGSSGYNVQVQLGNGEPAPTISPTSQGVQCSGGATNGPCNVYSFPPGTTATVTSTASSWQCTPSGLPLTTCTFSGWLLTNAQVGLVQQVSTSSITFTMNQPLFLTAQFTIANGITIDASSSGCAWAANGGTSPVTPSTAILSSVGNPSVTFSAASCGSSTFTGWILGSSASPTGATNVGTTNSVTITYNQAVAAGLNSNNPGYLTAQYTLGYVVTISASTGITVNPVPGTYNVAANTQYTITENTQLGYCFNGWIVNGQNQGTGPSITLTMNQDYIVGAAGLPTSQCSNGGGGPPGGGLGTFTIGQVIGGVSSLAGVVLIGLGMRRKR